MPDLVETMAFAGATPWHGKGTPIPAGATVDEMRALAGLTWEPTLLDLTYRFKGKDRTARDRAMVRNDTGAELDRVGPRYVPIKNAEVVEFFREYAEAGDMIIETLGVLDEGRYVWALAKVGAGFTLVGDDRVELYTLLYNPHLYGRGATAMITKVRVVCWNTAQLALGEHAGRPRTRVWHVSEFDEARRRAVKEELGIARDRLKQAAADAELLVATHLKPPTAQAILARLLGDPALKWEEQPRAAKAVWALYQGAGKGAALPSSAGTAWGLLNAVTEHVDWHHGKTQDKRLLRAWFGGGAALKRRTQEAVLAHARRGGKAA